MAAEALFQQIAAQAEATLREYRVPGMAVGIVEGGDLVYAQGFGTRRLGEDQPMTPQSVHSMASVSKAVTGTAIMQLVETGRLDIDQPLVHYLPSFRLADPRYPLITIRHLLSHQSGLPSARPEELSDGGPHIWHVGFRNDFAFGDTAESYVRSLTDITLLGDPGQINAYGDLNYDMLGAVIQSVTGEAFEDYCQRHIFQPLGMRDSTFRLAEAPPDRLVMPHTRDEQGAPIISPLFPYSRRHAPSGCLHTSVADLARWVRAHVNGGVLDGQRILAPESQRQLWEPLVYRDGTPRYGWGWPLREFDGHRVAAMFGGQPGVNTAIRILRQPRARATIALGNCLGSYKETFYAIDFTDWSLRLLLSSDDEHR